MVLPNGYSVIRNAIPTDVVKFVAHEFTLLYNTDKDTPMDDDQVPGAFTRPNLLSTDTLMLNLWNTIEEATGLELYPTYSYMRYYDLGQSMLQHTDRAACEYSITANLYNENEPWSIWFLHPKGYPAQVDLHPGDIAIYRGCDIPHWRDVNTVGKVAQTFLHYVDKNGPNAEWAFDKSDKEFMEKLWEKPNGFRLT